MADQQVKRDRTFSAEQAEAVIWAWLTQDGQYDPAVVPPIVGLQGSVVLAGDAVQIVDGVTPTIKATVDSDGDLHTKMMNSLVPKDYDYISLSYTGSNLTGVVFKTGGSGGTTVATLTLGYSGSQLTSVART